MVTSKISGRKDSAKAEPAPGSSPMVVSTFAEGARCSYVDLGDSARMAIKLAPRGRGTFAEQVREVLLALRTALARQPQPMMVTVQTIFLQDAENRQECERLFAVHYGEERPVTNLVLQAPCCGAALSVEAWAIGGKDVHVEHFGPNTLAVTYDSVRWVYCAGIKPGAVTGRGIYERTMDGLERMSKALTRARSGFEHVVRTWFYLGRITGLEGDIQRYQELNRARTDYYHNLRFCCSLLDPNAPRGVFPASTGIGMSGNGLVMSCLALQTRRDDVFLLPLENPQQTPAYAYHPKYSPQSPKFSRAMALVLGNYVTTWISGTASIVNSETQYPGEVAKQTEQTIDNIERLIAPENFQQHSVQGAGARLSDLAKVRVYIKRQEDFAACHAVCERRFGAVPAIYAVADICRPDLLVEIEGIAFSRYTPPQLKK